MPISWIPGSGLCITTDLAGTSVIPGAGLCSTTDPAGNSVRLITLAPWALAGLSLPGPLDVD